MEEELGHERAPKPAKPLLGMKGKKGALLGLGETGAGGLIAGAYMDGHNAIAAEGILASHIPPREPGKRGEPKKGKTRALPDRLVARQDDICRFMTNFDAPFVNSASERDIRVLKAKQKILVVCGPKRAPKASRRSYHASTLQRSRT